MIKSDHVLYKQITEHITSYIKHNKNWYQLADEADENKNITFVVFIKIISGWIPDITEEEKEILRNQIFPFGYSSMKELSFKLKINVLDQMRTKNSNIQQFSSTTQLQQQENELKSEEEIKHASTGKRVSFLEDREQPSFLSKNQPLSDQFDQQTIFQKKQVQDRQQQSSISEGQENQQIDQKQSSISDQQKFPQIEGQEDVSREKKLEQILQEENIQEIESASKRKGQVLKKDENVKQKITIDQQIQRFFEEIDENKNGWLDPQELTTALLQLGINPLPQDIKAYFQQFDKNQDEKISFQEFSQIVKDQLMKGFFSTDEIASLIAQEYVILSDANTNELDMPQLKQVFTKIGANLSNNDINDLFYEIDLDDSGYVEYQELINFLNIPFSKHSIKSQQLLQKINKTQSLSILHLREIFSEIPDNFTYSFLQINNKKNCNLPSSTWHPKLHGSGLFYQNIQLITAQKYNLENPLIDYLQDDPNIFYQFKLIQSMGIPSIDPEKCKKRVMNSREIGLCLFDKISQKYIGNTVYVQCAYDPNSPDKWLFSGNYPIIIGCNIQKDEQISLIIEFIGHLEDRVSQQLYSLSVCFGEIPLIGLKAGKLTLSLLGGSPLSNLNIDPKSIQAPTSLFSAKQAIPQIVIQFSNVIDKQKIIKGMPKLYLMPQNWATLIHDFREYIGYRSIKKGIFDDSLPDFKMKSFLDLLDIQECGDSIAQWWNENAKIKEHNKLLGLVDHLCVRSYLICQRTDFFFKKYPKVQRLVHKYSSQEKRRNCIREMLQDLNSYFGQMIGGRRGDNYFDMEPLILGQFEDKDQILLDKIIRKFHKE